MKFIHLSDLHIGKRVNEFSMIEDQRYIFNQIIDVIKEERPDAVLISGDIYDKSVPSEEAVELCDEFLTNLSELHIQICIISGNHDSAERLSFGSKLLTKAQIHISSVFRGEIESVVIRGNEDNEDTVIYMLPFVKPSSVRRFYPEENIVTYDDAVRVVLSNLELDPHKNNILMLHQFITGFKACESEDLSIGTLDQVSSAYFKEFDYVALGHIHGPQNLTLLNENGKQVPVRYCGTPLKYSFSEMNHHKSISIVEIKSEDMSNREKLSVLQNEIETNEIDSNQGNKIFSLNNQKKVLLCTRSLHPLHEMREIRGTYDQLTSREYYKDKNTADYFHVILTDEEDVPDALARMRSIYPNIMKFDYDNKRTREKQEITKAENIEKKTPQQLFIELYEMQNNQSLSDDQTKILNELVEEIWK